MRLLLIRLFTQYAASSPVVLTPSAGRGGYRATPCRRAAQLSRRPKPCSRSAPDRKRRVNRWPGAAPTIRAVMLAGWCPGVYRQSRAGQHHPVRARTPAAARCRHRTAALTGNGVPLLLEANDNFTASVGPGCGPARRPAALDGQKFHYRPAGNNTHTACGPRQWRFHPLAAADAKPSS